MGTEDAPGVEGADRRTPEAYLSAQQVLDAIDRDLEGDDAASLVRIAWSEGLRGVEAAEAAGLTPKEYDAARKRLLRKIAPHAAEEAQV